MNVNDEARHEGRCACGKVAYRLTGKPLVVHCCHCRWCQRETGSAFVLNAILEHDRVLHTADEPELVATPSESGRGQRIARCPACRVAVWSNYADGGEAIRFVRVGTLEEPDRLPPDIHIYTASRLPWVQLPAGVPAVPAFYDPRQLWPADSLARWRKAVARPGRA
jgi:hypothetical protein